MWRFGMAELSRRPDRPEPSDGGGPEAGRSPRPAEQASAETRAAHRPRDPAAWSPGRPEQVRTESPDTRPRADRPGQADGRRSNNDPAAIQAAMREASRQFAPPEDTPGETRTRPKPPERDRPAPSEARSEGPERTRHDEPAPADHTARADTPDVAELSRKVDLLTGHVEELQKDKEALTGKVDDLTKEVGDLTRKNADMSRELAETKKETASRFEAFRTELRQELTTKFEAFRGRVEKTVDGMLQRHAAKDLSRPEQEDVDAEVGGPAGIEDRARSPEEQREQSTKPTPKRRLPSSGVLGLGSAVANELVNITSHVEPSAASMLSHVPSVIGIGIATVGVVRDRRKNKDAN